MLLWDYAFFFKGRWWCGFFFLIDFIFQIKHMRTKIFGCFICFCSSYKRTNYLFRFHSRKQCAVKFKSRQFIFSTSVSLRYIKIVKSYHLAFPNTYNFLFHVSYNDSKELYFLLTLCKSEVKRFWNNYLSILKKKEMLLKSTVRS